MRASFESSWSVAFFAEGVAFDWGWLWDWAPSEDEPASGKRGISSSEGKLGGGFAGGRRLLMRGTSASARSKSVSDKASQFGIFTRDPDLAGATNPILRCLEAAEQVSRWHAEISLFAVLNPS